MVLEFTFFLANFVCFYVNYFFITPRLYDARKLYKLVIAFFLNVTCFVMVRYSAEEILLPATLGFRNYIEGTDFWFYFYDNIFYSSLAIFISTTFWFFKYYINAEAEKTQLVEARRIAELQALRTQINPHFIFNSLNNIYSLVYQQSDKALPAIEELSTLLRYSTKDLEKDCIPLDKEIGYIDSLTALEKLRLKNPELLVIEKNIRYPHLNISPMLLVPFVENAFKHGDFRNKGLEMRISDKDQMLHFYLLNFKNDRKKDVVSGIGIENVKKRLEILYPKKYTLAIDESETEFMVDLTIDLRDGKN